LEERRREKFEKERAETCVDVLEIDLDEDGPLREEYLPKRRVSGSVRSFDSADIFARRVAVDNWEKRSFEIDKLLPPPAKWSPSGDEPILRERNRVSGHYVAVQPPRLSTLPFAVSPSYHHQIHDIGYQNWPSADGYVLKQPSATAYTYDAGPHHLTQPTYSAYPLVLPIASHSRSHSSYKPDNSQLHTRSYSQSRVEYRCSDIRMTANELGPMHRADDQWPAAQNGYASYGHAYAPHPNVNYQSTWLRT